MAGYLNAERLNTYAIIGAKSILTNSLLKISNSIGHNCTFEENPEGCFRFLMISFLNDGDYLSLIANRHPELLPSAEAFLSALRTGGTEMELYAELFNEAVSIYAKNPKSNIKDIDFTIMLAALLGVCFTDEDRSKNKDIFFTSIENWDGEILGKSCLLLPCALWGCNYENYRELLSAQYYELKAQGFGAEEDIPEPDQSSKKNQKVDFNNRSQEELIQQAKEQVEHYAEKLQFISEVNEQITRNIDSLDSRLDIGKKYCSYYMEIERFYVDPIYRLGFITFCSDAQPETLLKNGGFVSFDYFVGQVEKYLQSVNNPNVRIQFIRGLAQRANSLWGWEMMRAIADGDFDSSNYGWWRICEYIYGKSEEWGWDGYLEDGKEWGFLESRKIRSQAESKKKSQPQPVPSSSSVRSNTGANSSGCYIATAVYGSYDRPEVWVLRRFRDFSLSKTWYGQTFIKLYYAVSPTLVKWFGDAKWFKCFWRARLDKLVNRLRAEGFEDTPYEDKN